MKKIKRSSRPFLKLTLLILATLVATNKVRADGLIVIPGPPEGRIQQTPFPLEVKYHRVEVDINDLVAKTSVDQEFFNPTNLRLEGLYIFPVPERATINNFLMEINGKMVSAEMLDAKKARDIYEDIVRKMRDPALLEYSGQGLFKLRIFPIEPRSTKRVKISYTQRLPVDNNLVNYVYPLNTEKFSAKPLEEISIKITLKTTGKIKTIFSPTHPVEVKRHSEHSAVIGFENNNIKPNTDFSLYYDTDEKKVGLSLLTYRPSGKDGFFLLTAAPSFDTDPKGIIPKEITFVFDTSGSMAGKKMEQAKKALLFCLNNLNLSDRFEIVRFSTEAEALFGTLQPAVKEKIEKAKEFVTGLKPIGGTNIEEALAKALEANQNASERPKFIIFLTDGKPTIGITDEMTLVNNIEKSNRLHSRIFTFGIGDDLNTHLLDRITEVTHAYRTYVRPGEDIEIKLSGFYEKIKSPVLADLKIRFGSEVKVFTTYPKELPDLFKGTQLTVFGRYNGNGDTTVTLEGLVERNKSSFQYRVNFPEKNELNEFIAPLWAAQRIGYLLDQVRLHGAEKELKDEIIELARNYGIITPYTSYLIIEDEKRSELAEEKQTLGKINIASDLTNRIGDDYLSMHRKSGAGSVTASQEVEGLKRALNYQDVYQGQSRLNYSDQSGKVTNLTAQTRNIQGRAFYQTGKFWVDSRVQAVKNQSAKRIQFASPEYFRLLNENRGNSQFMALGQNVRFVIKDTIYEIFE